MPGDYKVSGGKFSNVYLRGIMAAPINFTDYSMTITYGSVCSGIEAATVAWHPLGWTPAWFSEIEPFPSAVLAHHYPDVPNLGDMTKIAERIRAGEVSAPDVLVGGTPCQAFSVAGMRGGLSDARGQLTISFVELANEIDRSRAAAGHEPATIVWENVPGVLSSKDNAFGCFLGALAGESDALQPPGRKWANAGYVRGPQRTIAWRILDAQYFGVAQRRRRVFVVASAGTRFDPATVLFEFEGVRRDTAPSRGAGQEVAGTITACSFVGGPGGKPEGATVGHFRPVIAKTLCAGGNSNNPLDETLLAFNSNAQPDQMKPDPHTSAPLTCSQYSAVCVTGAVTHTLKAEGFDASEDGTGRGQPIVACMDSQLNAHVEMAPTMRAQPGGLGYPTSVSAAIGWNGDITPKATEEIMPCMRADQGSEGYGVAYNMAVRRLTPRECERLQAFPDDYTLVPLPLKSRQTRIRYAADGPRYKALGNSMCVNVMHWIGKRLDRAMRTAAPANDNVPAPDEAVA